MDKKRITIYFIRHGETYLNKYKRMQGWADTPLTKEGEVVAKKTGEILSDLRFDAVYSSDLGRTIQTAKIIVKENNYASHIKIQPKMEFRESFFGYFEGALQSDAYQTFAKAANKSIDKMFEGLSLEEFMNLIKQADPFHEAENYEELWERLDRGLAHIIGSNDNAKNSNILVVTHGNVIRNIFTKMDATISPAIEILNSGISTLIYQDGEFKVSGFNQTKI
ncbi:histidine phosphatase family protein [Candidatus Galacturonibacter soehngenii]|nr:histidine phosphatase family protein [Candidatus Galacturonibacter soehngenii]